MKPIKTLEELREALMSEHGAIRGTQRFRLNEMHLETFRENYWTSGVGVFNHGFLLELENWYYYEKPKKIVKEEIEGFVSDRVFEFLKGGEPCSFSPIETSYFKHKGKLIIEREVDDE